MCVGWSSFGSSTLLLLLDLMSVICNGNITDAEVPSQLNDLPSELNPVPVDQSAHLAVGPVCVHAELMHSCPLGRIDTIYSVINHTFPTHFSQNSLF